MDLQQIEQQVIKAIEDVALPQIKALAKKEVELHSDEAVDFVVAELEKLHPPAFVDGIIQSQKEAVKVALKAFLLSAIDKV